MGDHKFRDLSSKPEYSAEEKYFLLLLYAPDHTEKFHTPIKGDTWLQKEMFLLSKNVHELNLEFDEHHFGAFSPVVQVLTLQHANSNMIEQPNEKGPIYLTEKGIKVTAKLWHESSKYEKDVVTEVKKFLNDMTLWELIAFSYSTFPETTTNSDVLPQYYDTRYDAAISLFKKKKVSLEAAASIAGTSIEQFMFQLKKRNVIVFDYDEKDFRDGVKFLESNTRN